MSEQKSEAPVLAFGSQEEWEAWLASNHASSDGIWLRLYKKGSGLQSLTYAQALDEALCYGWIDGQKKSYDAESWLQKFTPRRRRSVWSKVNTQHVERLAAAGKMRPAGLQQVEEAKRDGRWESAYDPPSKITVPEDFLQELAKHPEAGTFFETLNKTNTYAIAYRLQSAKKPETRQKRMQSILEMLARGEKFHA